MYERIAQARFFRAKQAGITRLTECDSVPVGPARWVLADIDGDLYQLVLQGDADVLAEVLPEVRESYLAERAFGAGELEVLSRPIIPASGEVTLSAAEQSNSSIIFAGERPAIAKIFRMLEPGINPDVELMSGLAKVGCEFVPALRAYSTTTWQGEAYVTAMIQDFVSGAREGWDLAQEYAAQGKSFSSEAELIGTALRAVHTDLVSAFGAETVPAAQVVAGLEQRLDDLVRSAPILAEFDAPARDLYTRAATGTTQIQRIHGDAHLGQILRTADRYLFIDFEGEPARPLAERRGRFSPLQDVAGLLRSFDYATPGKSDEVAAAFLGAYGASSSSLLEALVLDKAMYEVAYEANNRPDWINIPLGAVKRLLG